MKKLLLILLTIIPFWAMSQDGGRSEYRNRTDTVFVVDENTHLTKDGSNNLVLEDAIAGSKTLAELAAGSTPTRQTLTSSASITFDYDLGEWAKLTLATNATLTFNDVPDFGVGKIEIHQDGTGSRTLAFAETITAVTSIEYAGGLELINPSATTRTNLYYEVDDDILTITLVYTE